MFLSLSLSSMWLWILCWQGDRQVRDVTFEWNASAFDLSHVLALGASMGLIELRVEFTCAPAALINFFV
ncbi:hypothetical protein COCSUDRAFT_54157 [Coccomyxa subellipsoidea C-169]|uniref:Uncharacterized protein n=1 Tax=Coccomyxa subellipsoidea (strain C-169) TaxID=574566 RepID=I0YS37_COCSC|nr:hypothetical protein COCSUDRAFT_54157 [Coccomyxa subellipsoidea C-169]EIE21206.1 hypothetical protein COCSUDRAFT_54157 [Coccomyxa subellipsoidea C-169]|eukprot:XP_005645750.1 hypothetical protein COCSUDRAFT_54157 [Coccomyxa subellipsoidea C-169]